ncbi:hypothetical protein [Paracoccus halophilus]|uniref:hypothetical protein n=1 Tax=Paracoccus halophilus TaxID=376733 RepID=UPI0012E05DCA|nr:hypothetical protein [Paracoccus halophilus]
MNSDLLFTPCRCHKAAIRKQVTLALVMSLGVIMALSSAISAALMAPDRATVELQAYAMVYGSVLGDLCGKGGDAEYRCPLCHSLPKAPISIHEGRFLLLEPHEAWRCYDDLHRAAQARNLRHSPRAPPVPV